MLNSGVSTRTSREQRYFIGSSLICSFLCIRCFLFINLLRYMTSVRNSDNTIRTDKGVEKNKL